MCLSSVCLVFVQCLLLFVQCLHVLVQCLLVFVQCLLVFVQCLLVFVRCRSCVGRVKGLCLSDSGFSLVFVQCQSDFFSLPKQIKVKKFTSLPVLVALCFYSTNLQFFLIFWNVLITLSGISNICQ